MDRRQQKTTKAIFDAFNNLLLRKSYGSITVQNIIDEANIGRSTFYLHYETKEVLLDAMCDDFFRHIIKTPPSKEKTHDFSRSKNDLADMVTHILYHLRDSSSSVYGLLKSDMSHYFYNKLEEIFREWCLQNLKINNDIPQDLSITFITGNLINLCKWWVKTNLSETPEKAAEYYLEATRYY